MKKPKIIFVVGPTASGKSALAVKIARRIGSDVISADSMQIYKSMDVGTAKATEAEMQGVRHFMINVAEPSDDFSVAEYSENAEKYIENMQKDGKIPVVCGGTGLYVESLLYPLNFANTEKSSEIRDKLNAEYDEIGGEAMWERLYKLDPESAGKLHPNDKKRLVRALEILLSGEKKTTEETREYKCDPLIVVLNFEDRAKLYERIDKRVDLMFENGLLEEAEGLIRRGVKFLDQSFQAIGYKEFAAYFAGEQTLAETKELIKKNSRNYAKRQLTWFKRYKTAVWFSPDDEEKIFETVDRFLEK